MKENQLGIYEWDLEEERSMIGKDFVLLKPKVVRVKGKKMECMMGAVCFASGLVDYGEGLLLEVTAEGHVVGQFDEKDFFEDFREMEDTAERTLQRGLLGMERSDLI